MKVLVEFEFNEKVDPDMVHDEVGQAIDEYCNTDPDGAELAKCISTKICKIKGGKK